MYRGVSFKITPKMDNTDLPSILRSVKIDQYKWYNIVDQSEVWFDGEKENPFDKDYYSGIEFSEVIQKNHYIIFLKLQAYFQDGKFGNIHTYEDFLKSDCQILLIINDCEFVDIYCKDILLVNSIYKNAAICGFKDIEFITDYNDSRTKMDNN